MGKPKNDLCNTCSAECPGSCAAVEKLIEIYNTQRTEEKRQLIKELRSQLDLMDCELSPEYEALANRIIDKRPEVQHIREYEIKVGYVLSYEAKKKDGKIVFADCRKVNGPWLAFLPYDYIITFYEPNIDILTDNQKKIVVLHELCHPMIGPRGLTNRPHDVEDFKFILHEFGIDYLDLDQEVRDILEE
jgi:predicted metallopeptidase